MLGFESRYPHTKNWGSETIVVKIRVKVGDNIELVHTTDEMTRLEPGDKGKVTKIEGETGDRLIWVKWKNGETLALLEEIDKFKIIK